MRMEPPRPREHLQQLIIIHRKFRLILQQEHGVQPLIQQEHGERLLVEQHQQQDDGSFRQQEELLQQHQFQQQKELLQQHQQLITTESSLPARGLR